MPAKRWGWDRGTSMASPPRRRSTAWWTPPARRVRVCARSNWRLPRVAAEPPAAAADVAALRAQFTRWAANDRDFEPLAQANSLLEELKPISKDLSARGAPF